jgi:hypothetical protein
MSNDTGPNLAPDLSGEKIIGSTGLFIASPKPSSAVNINALNNVSLLAEPEVPLPEVSRIAEPGLFSAMTPAIIQPMPSTPSRPVSKTGAMSSRVAFTKKDGKPIIVLNPKSDRFDPIARPSTSMATQRGPFTVRQRTSSMIKSKPPVIPSISIPPSVIRSAAPSPSPINTPRQLKSVKELIPSPSPSSNSELSYVTNPIKEWSRSPPQPQPNPSPKSYNIFDMTISSSKLGPIHPNTPITQSIIPPPPVPVLVGLQLPNLDQSSIDRDAAAVAYTLQHPDFNTDMALIDSGGHPLTFRHSSEPPLNSTHVRSDQPIRQIRNGPIPLPPTTDGLSGKNLLAVNTAHAINGNSINMGVLLSRQEFAIAQNAVNSDKICSELVDVEFAQNKLASEVSSNTKAISDLSLDLINFRKSMGKSRLDNMNIDPVPNVKQPEPQALSVLEELRILSANITSLAAQMGSMQNSIDNINSRLSHPSAAPISNASGNPPVPHQTTPIQRKSSFSSKNPFRKDLIDLSSPGAPPASLPYNSPKPTQRPVTPTQPNQPNPIPNPYICDPLDNYKFELDEGHEWFTHKLIELSSIPDKSYQIHSWARVLSMGQWGPILPSGLSLGIAYNQSLNKKKHFICECIRFAFRRNGAGRLPLPPTLAIPNGNLEESKKFYTWLTYTGIGHMTRRQPGSPVNISYAPGRGPHTKATVNAKGPNVPQPPPPPPRTPTPNVRFAPEPAPSTAPSPPIIGNPAFDSDLNFNTQPEVWFEDQHGGLSIPEDNTWKTVRNNKPSFATIASQAQGIIQPRKKNFISSTSTNKWVLQFPKQNKIPPGSRPAPNIVTDKINITCKEYNIHAVMAEWSAFGNLVVTFKFDSKEKNISNAAATILNLFCPDAPTKASFSKVVHCSKILFPRIPCRSITMEITEGDAMRTNDLWSTEELIKEVRKSHPILEKIEFVQEPTWTIPVFCLRATSLSLFRISAPFFDFGLGSCFLLLRLPSVVILPCSSPKATISPLFPLLSDASVFRFRLPKLPYTPFFRPYPYLHPYPLRMISLVLPLSPVT